jgi:hypothetical protein
MEITLILCKAHGGLPGCCNLYFHMTDGDNTHFMQGRCWSSGLLRSVVYTNISEKHAVSIFIYKQIAVKNLKSYILFIMLSNNSTHTMCIYELMSY